SGESPFSGMVAEAWEKEYWGSVDVILKMQGQSLDSWLGAKEAEASAQIVQQAKEAVALAVENRITLCKEAFNTQYGSEKKRKAASSESEAFKWWEDDSGLTEDMERHERAQCPA